MKPGALEGGGVIDERRFPRSTTTPASGQESSAIS